MFLLDKAESHLDACESWFLYIKQACQRYYFYIQIIKQWKFSKYYENEWEMDWREKERVLKSKTFDQHPTQKKNTTECEHSSS